MAKLVSIKSKSLRVIVTRLENETTRMEPFEDKDRMRVVKVEDDGLVLEIPSRLCANGHHLSFHITTDGFSEEHSFNGTGKVAKLETTDDKDHVQIHIKFMSYDTMTWKLIQSELARRQGDVMKLFKAMKGD